MPMDLLDVLLTLVDEEQLRWDVLFTRIAGTVGHLIIVLFHREIPEGDLVIRTGCRKDGILSWVPLDGCDRGLVPIKRGHRDRI